MSDAVTDQIPFVNHMPGGRGVSVNREEVPMKDTRPYVCTSTGNGQGIQIQRDTNQAGPYATGKRSTGLYQGDNAAASDVVAAATYAWAVEHGDKYRVAYCMHEGDFPIPPGWTAETMGFSGHRDPAKKEKAVDQVIFSPACVPVPTDPQLGFGW